MEELALTLVDMILMPTSCSTGGDSARKVFLGEATAPSAFEDKALENTVVYVFYSVVLSDTM